MKKLIEEVDGEGLESFLGEDIVVWCSVYIYTGKLSGVSEECILLKNAYVVYETGGLCDKNFKDAQKLPNDLYINKRAIECSYKRKC
jgi:hypothetical protein